jgi:hypothetical protein
MLGSILLTWVLMGTVTTLQCKGDTCQPTPASLRLGGPHTLSTFHSREECASYKQFFEQKHPPVVVPSQTRPEVTVRKVMTFTCEEREGGQ